MISKCQIRRYKKVSDGVWSSSYETIDLTDMTLTEGLTVTRDMFNLTIDNPKGKNASFFNVDDRVEIYLYTGSSPSSDDLIFDGLILETDYELSTKRLITIRGANRTQELLSNLVLLTFANNTKKTNEAIFDIISQVNNNNRARSNFNSQRWINPSGIVTTNSKGEPLPIKNFVVTYKPAYDAILQFSDNEYTNDGQYIFYVDHQNVFHWTYKSTIVPPGYTFSEGDVIKMRIQRGVWSVYNSVIADVGKDCNNHGNHILQINPRNALSQGAKWKFLDYSSISPNLIDEQYKKDPSKWDQADEGNMKIRKGNYPNTYPFTMTFKKINDENIELDESWVVSNDNEFNKAIRMRAKYEGRQRAKGFLEKYGEVQYKAQIEINGTTSFEKGYKAFVTSPSAGLNSYPLRIVEISHSFNSSGWITALNLEEDTDE